MPILIITEKTSQYSATAFSPFALPNAKLVRNWAVGEYKRRAVIRP